jgi:Carboxypeptidase regulatory-like domain
MVGLWLGTTNTDWQTATNWSNGIQPPDGNNISIPAVANKPSVTTADVLINDLTLNGDDLTIGAGRTVTASGNIALGANNILGTGKLSIGDTSTVTRTTGHVECTLEKSYTSPQAFTYPVGTTGAYSPVDVNVTAGPGILSVLAHTGTAPATPPLDATKVLQRYWTLNGSGITTDVTFHYLDPTDIPATSTESQYNIIRVLTGGTALRFAPNGTSVFLDTTNNTFSVKAIQSFSDWTAGNPLAPTAEAVAVSGHVTNDKGKGVNNATVTATDDDGNSFSTTTDHNGYYKFDGLESGKIYIFFVTSKQKLSFAARAVSVDNDITDLDFAAQ